MFKFEVGQSVKDVVSEFEGVVMGRTEYYTGCRQYAVCPRKVTKDGDIPGWEWLDEGRLKKTKKKALKFMGNEPTDDGGPMPTAPTMN